MPATSNANDCFDVSAGVTKFINQWAKVYKKKECLLPLKQVNHMVENGLMAPDFVEPARNPESKNRRLPMYTIR